MCRPSAGTLALARILSQYHLALNGLGLDLNADRPLFGLFQRFHNHVDGSGVGLYIVKKMVENAGGIITVQSQLGEGSTFTVAFKG